MGFTGFVTKRQLPTGDKRQKRIVAKARRSHGKVAVYLAANKELGDVITYITTWIDRVGGLIDTAVWEFDVENYKVVVTYEFSWEVM